MTKNEHKQITELIQKINEVNIDGIMRSIYYSEALRDTESIQGFSPNEIKNTLSDVLLKLTKELQANWKILPTQLAESSNSIAQQLQLILTDLINRTDFLSWINSLIWLIQYEMQFGFWENTESKIKLEIRGFEREIKNNITVLRGNINETESLKKILEGHLGDVQKLHELYQQERQELNRAIESADIVTKELRQTELDTATNNGKASAIIEQAKNNIELNERTIDETRQRFILVLDETKKAHDEYIKGLANINDNNDEFEKLLVSAREKENRILSQEEDINRLRGYLADNTLADAFSKRSIDIEKSVTFWRYACFGASIFALFWILAIFSEYRGSLSATVNWQVLILNILRTSPAIAALYFCFSQYGKERNLQEEYAFKAAVSKTITPYSDMIKDVAEKTKVLSSTVQGVYTPPVLGEPFKPISFNSKDLVDMSKNLLDSAKSIQEAGANILKFKISSDSKEEKKDSGKD